MGIANSNAVKRIIIDKELAPFFIDYLGENLKMKLGTAYKIESHNVRFKRDASKSLIVLIKKLESRVEADAIYSTIELGCKHYLRSVFPYQDGV